MRLQAYHDRRFPIRQQSCCRPASPCKPRRLQFTMRATMNRVRLYDCHTADFACVNTENSCNRLEREESKSSSQ